MAKKQYPRQRPPAKKKTLPLFLAVVLVLAVLAVCLWGLSAPFPRLQISGHPITREEYTRAMYQARNDVLSDHAAAGISLTDWQTETALGDPCRLVTDRALEILAEYYAVSTLAVERGYLADAGYDAMIRDMEEINRQRQEALESGAVITGFPHFTLDDYISYRASGIRLQFCNDPDNPEYQVTQEEIRQRYEADRDTLYHQPDSLDLAYLAVSTSPQEADALETAFQAAREIGDLAAALEAMPELKPYYQELSVDPGNYAVYDRSHSDILACAADLQTGEISQVFRQEGWLCLVQCVQRTVHQYMPLEDVESVVVQSIRESRYDDLIEIRMADISIQGDLNALYRFTAEQFT